MSMSLCPVYEYINMGVFAVECEMVWAKISVAVDSGACAHVTPKDVFSVTCEESAGSKAGEKWFGAEGTSILNLGKQMIDGFDDNGFPIQVRFNVASKLSRPLMSVFEIAEQGLDVHFSKGEGWIESGSQNRTMLRCEGKLWMLDIWTQVPRSIANLPFARPS